MTHHSESAYYPLVDTLRLYAGWLFACLSSVEALSAYQQLRDLPWKLSVLDEWGQSPVLLEVTFLAFLFLLATDIHRTLNGGIWKGTILMAGSFVLFLFFVVNS